MTLNKNLAVPVLFNQMGFFFSTTHTCFKYMNTRLFMEIPCDFLYNPSSSVLFCFSYVPLILSPEVVKEVVFIKSCYVLLLSNYPFKAPPNI